MAKKFNPNDLTTKKAKMVDKNVAKEKIKKIDTSFSKEDIIQDLRKEVTELVRIETNNTFKALTPTMLKVAREYAEGATDFEIKRDNNLDHIEYEQMLQN